MILPAPDHDQGDIGSHGMLASCRFKPSCLLRSATLATQTTGRGLLSDPFEFVLQATRRLPTVIPRLLSAAIRFGNPGEERLAAAAWIRGESTLARERLISSEKANWGKITWGIARNLEVIAPVWEPPSLPVEELLSRSTVPPRVRTTRRRGGDGLSVFHLLTNSLPYTTSGYALRSHQVLLAQRRAGVRVAAATRLGYPVVVGGLFAPRVSVVDGIPYHRLLPFFLSKSMHRQVEQAANLLAPVVEEFGATVLSTTTDYTNSLVAQRVAARLDIPWTYEIRGLPDDSWVSKRPSPELQQAAVGSRSYLNRQELETRSADAADHVFTLGRALRDDFVKRGIAEGKITVVNNAAAGSGPAATTFADSSTRTRQKLGLPPEGFWIGSVSSLVAYEGFDTLLRAVRLAREQGGDIRVLLVGDGVARPGLERLANELGLTADAAVVFIGKVSPQVAKRYYRALDLFAVPRRNHRVCRLVQPLKPLEACAAGVPLLLSDLPALQALALSGAGVTVPPDDIIAWASAMSVLAKDPRALSALGGKARDYAQSHTWDLEGRKYRDIYLKILSENSAV